MDFLKYVVRLNAKPDLLNLADKYGYTALHYSTQNDHTDIVLLLLLEMNAYPNTCVCGASPLHRAGTFIHAYIIHAIYCVYVSIRYNIFFAFINFQSA